MIIIIYDDELRCTIVIQREREREREREIVIFHLERQQQQLQQKIMEKNKIQPLDIYLENPNTHTAGELCNRQQQKNNNHSFNTASVCIIIMDN